MTETTTPEWDDKRILATVKAGQRVSQDVEVETMVLDLISKGLIALFNLKDGPCQHDCQAVLGLTDAGEAELTRLEGAP